MNSQNVFIIENSCVERNFYTRPGEREREKEETRTAELEIKKKKDFWYVLFLNF
jgi:hypothetical protein